MRHWQCARCLCGDKTPPSKLVIDGADRKQTLFLCEDCAAILEKEVSKARDKKLGNT